MTFEIGRLTLGAAQHRLQRTAASSWWYGARCWQWFWFAKESCLPRLAAKTNRWAAVSITGYTLGNNEAE